MLAQLSFDAQNDNFDEILICLRAGLFFVGSYAACKIHRTLLTRSTKGRRKREPHTNNPAIH